MDIQDHSPLKELSKVELYEMIPSWFEFKTEPWKQQLVCFVASIAYDGFLNCLDLGTGKTKVAIDLCRYKAHEIPNLKIFVVCMNNAVEKWAHEISIHSDIRATCLRGSSDEKWAKLDGDGFFIVNFEGLWRWLCSMRDVRHWASDVTKKKLAIDNKKIKRLLSFGFSLFIIDESHTVKDSKSLTFKICNRINKAMAVRSLLTGQPFGQSLLEIWSQYYLVDGGEAYGTNFARFRDMNFKDVGWYGPSYEVTEDGKARIVSKLFSRALRYDESEVEDLPEKVYRIVNYELSPEQDRKYLQLIKKEAPDLGHIVNKSMVYRQICGGFIKTTGKVFKQNPKLDMLQELIEEVIDRHKVVIFHEFTQEGVMIEEMLKRIKVKYNLLNGRVKDKRKENMLFETDDEYRAMVAHPKSGGSSIDLLAGTYMFFYSNGRSVTLRRQCEKRIHRGGQTASRTFFYDLICKSSVELGIWNDLVSGIDAFTKIMDGKSYRQYIMGER